MTIAITSPSLVLNKNWRPIGSSSFKKTMKAVYKGRALIVDPADYMTYDIDSWIGRGVELAEESTKVRLGLDVFIARPEVIVTTKYDRIPKMSVVFCRRNLWRRDAFRCQFCGKRPPQDEISIDHLLPKSRGGVSSFENCVLACMRCNKKKNNKTPKESGMRLIRTRFVNEQLITEPYDMPSRPVWSPLYALRQKTYPASWKKFLSRKDVNMLYWETELVET